MNWLELCKLLTKPLPVASSLFLLTGTSILLFSSNGFIEHLGMTYILQNHRWAVGTLFLIGLCWLAIAILLYVAKLVFTRAQIFRSKRLKRKKLHQLTSDERGILRTFVTTETRTQNFVFADIATAQGLAETGILKRASISAEGLSPAVSYCIDEYTLAYLTARQELVAETVSISQHKEKALLPAVGKAILWLLEKFWGWGPLSFIVGTICIGVGIVVAQEHMYGLARCLVAAGAILVPSKVIHDALKEKKPFMQVLAASLISVGAIAAVTWGAFWIIKRIEWKNEVIIRLTFKSSPLFTPKRQREIIWDLNKYYRYLTGLGFDLPADIPPLGLTPPHGILSGGGSARAPYYFSSLYISEDLIDNPNVLLHVYSIYSFDRILLDPYSSKPKAQVDDEEVAAWIYSCYFPASFSEQQVCANDTPGHKWNDALWEIRHAYGADYTDKLLCYALKMWKGMPPKYVENFDRFFRYKLASGESVADNQGGQRYWELNAILQRNGIDTAQPQ